MHKYLKEYPPAPEIREQTAKEMFPYLDQSPELYAAKNAHKWGSFSFGEYIYADNDLNEWLHTLDDIFFTKGMVDKVRNQLLTPEEIAEIRKSEREF
jgi:hypothetical protein